MDLDEEAYGVDDVMSVEFTSKMVKSSVKTENNFTFGFYTYHHRHRKKKQPATWAMWFRPRELSMGEILKVSLFFVAFSEIKKRRKKISTISIPPRAAIFCCLLCHPSSGCRCHPCVRSVENRVCMPSTKDILCCTATSRESHSKNDTQNFFSFLLSLPHHPTLFSRIISSSLFFMILATSIPTWVEVSFSSHNTALIGIN